MVPSLYRIFTSPSRLMYVRHTGSISPRLCLYRLPVPPPAGPGSELLLIYWERKYPTFLAYRRISTVDKPGTVTARLLSCFLGSHVVVWGADQLARAGPAGLVESHVVGTYKAFYYVTQRPNDARRSISSP